MVRKPNQTKDRKVLKTFVTPQTAETFQLCCYINYTDVAKELRKFVDDYISKNKEGLELYREQKKEIEGILYEWKD